MTQDEHDAKCWRALKRAVSAEADNKRASREARQMAKDFGLVILECEVAVEEGRV